MRLEDGIGTIKNIGAQRMQKFNAANIYTVRDLIEYFPRDYEDRSVITNIVDCCPDSIYTIRGHVLNKFETTRVKDLTIIRGRIKDDTAEIEVVWFNQPYLKNNFKPELTYNFTGRVSERFGKLQIESPDYEIHTDHPDREMQMVSSARIIPVYVSLGKISQKVLRGFVKYALDNITEELEDFLPGEIKKKYDLCNRAYATNNIHFPENSEAFFYARRRLVFVELLISQLALYKIKGSMKKETGIAIEQTDKTRLLNMLPYELTNAQKKVLAEMERDINSGVLMSRLVQGDVGSGKTAVAMLMAYICITNGYQAALMAPTEVLANQHFIYFQQYFSVLGIGVALLSGNIKKKEKLLIYEQITDGTVHMVIGTHALIEEGVHFKNLALAITDEQHRFGVRQRIKLSDRGTKEPHVLVMTATPIPRTLALILYGDLDISIIDELPPGRQKIETYSVNSTYRDRIYSFIKKEVDKKRQVYIICPTIEQGEKNESKLKAVVEHAAELSEAFGGCVVECLHGKMKNDVKQEIMSRFTNGEIDVLVSTTVIEVGINVPNATVMLIENAERFGLSQLHQLRGRVGRGSEKSFCILMTDSKNKITKERMKAMTDTTDGFKISEMDLSLRGPGDYFGTRQHGLPEFKIANLYKDIEILKQAQEAVDDMIEYGSYNNNNHFNKKLDDEINAILYNNKKISL